MNWDQVKNNWNMYKTQIKNNFNKLSDDDINNIRDNFRERLVERIQNRYGYDKNTAQQKLDDFVNNLKTTEKV